MNKTKIKQLVKEELAALAEGGRLQNTAKGAAMALINMAKVMLTNIPMTTTAVTAIVTVYPIP